MSLNETAVCHLVLNDRSPETPARLVSHEWRRQDPAYS